MEDLEPAPQQQVSSFMRPFVLGATAYLVTLDILFMATRGQVYSPDSWSDVYMLLLAAYAGGAEVAHLVQGTDSAEEGWRDRIQKGGPLITLWLGLLLAAGVARVADPSIPMPAELKETAMKVIGVFLGTYALRQYRRARVSKASASGAKAPALADPEAAKILDHLRRSGPRSPQDLADQLGISRRSVARLLKALAAEDHVVRQGGPFDPSAVYRAKT